ARTWWAPHGHGLARCRGGGPARRRARGRAGERCWGWVASPPAAAAPAGVAPAYAATPVIVPPLGRWLNALRRDEPDVSPSAWNHENIGFRSSPLNGVNSGLMMNA